MEFMYVRYRYLNPSTDFPQSTILERDLEIGEDPRGVYLAGEAVRILYQLGIGDQMRFIGQGVSDMLLCPSRSVGLNKSSRGEASRVSCQ